MDPEPLEIEGGLYLSDFAKARNHLFGQIDSEYILWIDSDDVFWNVPGFLAYYRDIIRFGEIDAFWMTYDYEHDALGNCTLRQGRERIVRRDTHIWRSPIHEVLCAIHQFSGAAIPENEARIIHKPMTEEERKFKNLRNARVAEHFIKKMGGDVEPRMWLNYANSLVGLERHEEAISAYKRYLFGSEWNEERYHAFLSIAECCRKLGVPDKATDAVWEAIKLREDFREAYIELANSMVDQGAWKKALYWAKHALATENNNMEYKGNPYFLNARPWEIMTYCHMKLLEFQEAIDTANKLLDEFPGNHAILAHRTLCHNLKREQDAEEHFRALEDLIREDGSEAKLESLRDAVPRCLEDSPRVAAPVRVSVRPHALKICLHCGEGLRTWGHDSIERGGIGGSETAVIRITEELAKRGAHVEIYGYPSKEQEGEHNGVHWLPHWRIANPGKEFDVFINWRSPGLISKPPEATRKLVWLHDIQREFDWGPEVLAFYDYVMPLSEAHRRDVSYIPDEKIWISRNGLDPTFWEPGNFEEEIRNSHKLVYASCPSRGLHLIARVWDRILEAVPTAQIDVFYGFNKNFQAKMKVSQRFRDIYQEILAFTQKPGVNWYGMVDQKTLGRAFRTAGIWAYPCPFPEISCITAMQAQTCGALPITTKYWALDETVQFGEKVGDDPEHNIEDDPELLELWLTRLLGAIPREPKAVEHLIDGRQRMMDWAQERFPWSSVAEEWLAKFSEILAPETLEVPPASWMR